MPDPDTAHPSATDPGPARRSRMLGRRRRSRRSEGTRGALIATASTVVFVTVVVVGVLHSPGWPLVHESFFNGRDFATSWPDIVHGFWLNVRMFLIAEVLILVFALLLAIIRSLPGPVFFPLRALVVVYTDFFRGVPVILIVLLLGFGMPPLQLQGIPKSPVFWGVVALVLTYSAYVAEVYRAGIESVHPSQVSGARSLGLSRWQSLRFVVLPQAIRRVIPPLLNDFIGLQKDTALVAFIGPVEAVRAANVYVSEHFNYTAYFGAAILFILVTIPLARFTDWLIQRDRHRREGHVTV